MDQNNNYETKLDYNSIKDKNIILASPAFNFSNHFKWYLPNCQFNEIKDIKALDFMEINSNSILIIDEMLLQISSQDQIEWLFEKINGIPILVTSSLQNKAEIQAKLAKYFFEIIPKPVKPCELLDAVKQYEENLSLYKANLEKESTQVADVSNTKNKGAKINSTSQETDSKNALKILLVDDTLINQMVAQNLLALDGHKVEVANNGEEAVTKFLNGQFDLILMDCQMPVMDGFEATIEIRKLNSGKKIPIIALTANAQIEARQKCKDSGMNDCLTKPFLMDDLKKLIESHMTAS